MTKEDKAPQQGIIRVTALGGDTREIPFAADQSVEYYVALADITVGDGQSVRLSGKPVNLDTVITQPGGSLVVASNVANG